MGLDLHRWNDRRRQIDGPVSFRAGSYGRVHDFRVDLVKAFIKYREAHGSIDQLDADYELMVARGLLGDEYPELRTYTHLANRWSATLVGVIKWVNHSDCDGMLSPGDAFDVARAIVLLKPYMRPDEVELDYWNNLDEFLRWATTNGDCVIFS